MFIAFVVAAILRLKSNQTIQNNLPLPLSEHLHGYYKVDWRGLVNIALIWTRIELVQSLFPIIH